MFWNLYINIIFFVVPSVELEVGKKQLKIKHRTKANTKNSWRWWNSDSANDDDKTLHISAGGQQLCVLNSVVNEIVTIITFFFSIYLYCNCT